MESVRQYIGLDNKTDTSRDTEMMQMDKEAMNSNLWRSVMWDTYEKDMKIDKIGIDELKEKILKIKEFCIYNPESTGYYPNDNSRDIFYPLIKKQNVKTWSSKCNYLMSFIKRDIMTCLSLIENNKDKFISFRVSEVDKEQFYYIENVEYRISSLFDILAQMFNECFDMEIDVDKISYARFFKSNDNKNFIVNCVKEKYGERVSYVMLSEIDKINEYLDNNDDYSFFRNKRNSFAHRDNPHDTLVLSGTSRKMLVDHPLYELNICINVFVWIYLELCLIQKFNFFELKRLGVINNYAIVGTDEWNQ